MNNDPSPSSAAQFGAAASSNNDDDAATNSHQSPSRNGDDAMRRSGSGEGQRRRRKNRKKRNPGLKKKLTFVTHLLKGLDTVVLAELSALYYMECSLFRFLIRAAGQFMYLSPKDESFPFLMPASRMHVLLVVLPNLWCMLVHLFGAVPVGPEYHRGYLHGGLIFDFVGQKPPSYRAYYIFADLAVLALQCFMLTVHTEREKLRLSLKTFKPLFSDPTTAATIARTIEELDAEEQGIHHSLQDGENDTGDIELQSLGGAHAETSSERRSDIDASNRPGPELSRTHLADILNSGNAVLGEYHVIHTMRVAAMELEKTAAHSIQTIGYRATLAALEAQRRGVTLPARPGQTT